MKIINITLSTLLCIAFCTGFFQAMNNDQTLKPGDVVLSEGTSNDSNTTPDKVNSTKKRKKKKKKKKNGLQDLEDVQHIDLRKALEYNNNDEQYLKKLRVLANLLLTQSQAFDKSIEHHEIRQTIKNIENKIGIIHGIGDGLPSSVSLPYLYFVNTSEGISVAEYFSRYIKGEHSPRAYTTIERFLSHENEEVKTVALSVKAILKRKEQDMLLNDIFDNNFSCFRQILGYQIGYKISATINNLNEHIQQCIEKNEIPTFIHKYCMPLFNLSKEYTYHIKLLLEKKHQVEKKHQKTFSNENKDLSYLKDFSYLMESFEEKYSLDEIFYKKRYSLIDYYSKNQAKYEQLYQRVYSEIRSILLNKRSRTLYAYIKRLDYSKENLPETIAKTLSISTELSRVDQSIDDNKNKPSTSHKIHPKRPKKKKKNNNNITSIEETIAEQQETAVLQQLDQQYTFDQRVLRWFDLAFREGKSCDTLLYHSWALKAIPFIRKGIKCPWQNRTYIGQKDNCYKLSGEIIFDIPAHNPWSSDQKQTVVFHCTQNLQGCIYHIGLEPKEKNALFFNALDDHFKQSYWDVHFPPLNRVDNTINNEEYFVAEDDGSYIEKETDLVVVIKDPKNRVTIVLHKGGYRDKE